MYRAAVTLVNSAGFGSFRAISRGNEPTSAIA